MAYKEQTVYGVIAEFPNSAALLYAAEKVRQEGYRDFDCHSPFPIHGMDDAMGLKRSPLGWIVGIMALSGAVLGMCHCISFNYFRKAVFQLPGICAGYFWHCRVARSLCRFFWHVGL